MSVQNMQFGDVLELVGHRVASVKLIVTLSKINLEII